MDDLTTASYEEAGFGRATEFGTHPGVIVVDMCQAYFTEGSPLYLDRPEVVNSAKRVVEAARTASVPVLWTRVEYEPGGANGGVWYQKVGALNSFDRGNPLADWVPGLTPDPDEVVVTKQHASGFFGTTLNEELQVLGVDTVLVCGVSTSGCVRATVTDASAFGFAPFIIREAVGDRTNAVHEANLFDIAAKYGDVIDEHTGLDYLAEGIS